MKKICCYKSCKGKTFKKVLGITALALLMLVGIAGASQFAYITNGDSNNVSVIDISTNNVTASVSVGSNPMGVAVSPNGLKVYVGNANSNNISVIDTATNAVIATVPVGSNPMGVAVSPDGKNVYIANHISNTVSFFDTSTNKVKATVNIGKYPAGVAVSSDGRKVYVTNEGDNTVSVIDTATKAITSTVPVGSEPKEVAVSPDGTKVYVVNYDGGSVSVIDTATNRVTDTVNIGRAPRGVAFNPNGTKVYVTNNEEYFSTVSVIDTATNKVTSTIPVGSDPMGISVSPDGSKVYVAIHLYNTVSVIDTANNTVTATMLVGNSPYALGQFIGSIPEHPVYPSANFSSNITSDYTFISVPVQFTDLSKNATKWNWDFGDGANSTQQNPMHAYSAVGIYTVSLTVSNSNGTDSKLAKVNVVQKGSHTPSYVYITNLNSNTVTVINTANDNFTATVPVGTGPEGVAASPDGTKIYVTNINYGGLSTVSVIDTATNKVTATVPVGQKYGSFGVAVTSDGTNAYVADRDINCVSVIDTGTNTVIATIPVGKGPLGVAVNTDGTKVYVTNRDSNTISIIDTATNKVTATVPVGLGPRGVAVNPNGTKIFVTNGESNNVSVIDTAKNTVKASVTVGSYPFGVAVSPDGTKVYVANNLNNCVSVIDAATNTVTTTVPVGSSPYGVAVTSDGTKVYVANSDSNSVSVIDTATNKVTATADKYLGSSPIAFGQFIGPLPAQPVLPVANLSSNITSGYAPQSVQFTDLSKNSTAWNWDFGDGNNSTEQNPVHTYSIAGSYNVTLDATNANGTDSKIDNIAILEQPAFSASPTSGKTPLTVNFTDQSTGSPTSWRWDFGDGTNSTEKNPVHVYNKAGQYPVTLTLNNTGVISALTKSSYITASNGFEAPLAAFSASSTLGSVPLTVSFTDQSSGSPTSWNWNFGDGTYSSGQNPEHIYSKAGQYSVTLTASNAYGSNTLTKSSYIAVTNVLNSPFTDYSASTTTGNVPLIVRFTDQSTGAPTSWNWNFGDGNTSTDKNPVHTYNKTGQYSVTLTESNENGNDALTKSSYILVSSAINSPAISFSATPTSGNSPLTVSFTDQSTGSPNSWNWNFGDGNTSTERNPVHTYNKTGQYSVTLTESNENGVEAITKFGYIAVSGASNSPTIDFSATPTLGNMPLNVSFTDQSKGSPISWNWNFGDGNTSTDQNPAHTYNKTGLYSVTLTASNNNGSNALTKTNSIAVSGISNIPVISFSATTTSGNVPLTVSFTDQSAGSPTSWNWNFGDGNTSKDKNPVHTFNKTGLYSVTLTAGNDNGSNTLTKSGYIIVSSSLNAPFAAFSASPTSGSEPPTVSFTDQSTGSPTSWNWNFGDGNTSTEKNPVHKYNKSGLYSVSMTASNAGGSDAIQKSRYINVTSVSGGVVSNPSLNVPVTAFLATPTLGSVPLTVSFTDQSTGSPTSWNWNFGDGNTSTDRNPVHKYNKTGLYSVSLTTSNADGSNTLTKSSYMAVSNGLNTPVISFSASPTTGNVPLNVSFTDQSTGSPTSWNWNFGDGNTSKDQNPVHTFNNTGLYSVTLTASNDDGSNALTKTNYIAVSSSLNAPFAAFSASPTSGSVPLTVSFTDQSSGSPTSWNWNFGDGNASTDKNPVHTFNKTGSYSITLTASNEDGSNILTKSGYIIVSSSLNAPIAAFSASPTSGNVPLAVSFTDQSTGSPTSWNWDFGDGNASKDQNPVHKYNKTGLYSVSLTVSNANGGNALIKTGYIAVSGISDIPVTNFAASPTLGSLPFTVSFTDQSTGSPTSWAWNFGDGNTSKDQNPIHTFNKTGLYSVSLTSSNANGSNALTKSSCVAVSSVLNTPVAAFSASTTYGNEPLNVSFADQSSGSPTSWNWNFGDGNTSTDQNPVHTFNKSGLYSVTLSVGNANGSNALTKSSYIAVTNSLAAAFSAYPTSGSAPLSVNFTDNSTGSPTSWKWTFGDGDTSNETNPVHVFNKTEQYTVSLTVDDLGSSSTETKSGYIAVSK
jgi:YVTN family beta-propeller protein